MEENVCKSDGSNKRLMARIHKELEQLNSGKTSQFVQFGQWIGIDIYPKKIYKQPIST